MFHGSGTTGPRKEPAPIRMGGVGRVFGVAFALVSMCNVLNKNNSAMFKKKKKKVVQCERVAASCTLCKLAVFMALAKKPRGTQVVSRPVAIQKRQPKRNSRRPRKSARARLTQHQPFLLPSSPWPLPSWLPSPGLVTPPSIRRPHLLRLPSGRRGRKRKKGIFFLPNPCVACIRGALGSRR